MSDQRLRRRLAFEAALLMYRGQEKEYFTAKRKVARRRGIDPRGQPHQLPQNREIRAEILRLADNIEGDERPRRLGQLRAQALELMRLLESFHPRLIGSVATGHIRSGSDIDLHVFSDSIRPLTALLEAEGLEHSVEEKRIVKYDEERHFVHIHVPLPVAAGEPELEAELTVYPVAKLDYTFLSSITGQPIEYLELAELTRLLAHEHPSDRHRALRGVLQALSGLDGGPHHPEGCQLFHSLQVYVLARDLYPYDVELQEAALLHDVGKAIAVPGHAELGAEALEGLVSERTQWFVRHHMDAMALKNGKLGRRKARVLRASPDFEALMDLRDCDDQGREVGAWVPDLDVALAELEALASELG